MTNLAAEVWALRKTVLLGNKPDWRATITHMADPARFDILPLALDEDTIRSPLPELIVPLMVGEYDLLRAFPPAAALCLVPKAEHVRIAGDKLLFNRWLMDSGYGSCVARLYDRSQDVVFPVMRRARIDQWGRRSRLILNRAELAEAEAGEDIPGGTFLQACVPGNAEQATHIIAVEGQIVFKATVISLHRAPLFVKGKYETPVGETVQHGHAPPEIVSIVKRLSYTGCACFDYKLENGGVRLFELNPRIGGSFHKAGGDYLASYACGVSLQARLFR